MRWGPQIGDQYLWHRPIKKIKGKSPREKGQPNVMPRGSQLLWERGWPTALVGVDALLGIRA